MGIDCIIGNSGFVGGNLLRQHDFAECFNSRNIDDSIGSKFDTVVCAAAPGSMLQANNFPERDLEHIETLCSKLARIKARRFVLISSIAVIADFAGKDDESTEAFQTELAYGRHRRLLEIFCADHFDSTLIVRLPALFGHGLKKNFLFDLMNPAPSMLNSAKMEQALAVVSEADRAVLEQVYSLNVQNGMFVLDRVALGQTSAKARIENVFELRALTSVHLTHRDSMFQYYGVDRLWGDIELAFAGGIPLLHLATEPVAAAQIHQLVTGREMPETCARLHREDMHSLHTGLWARTGPYLEDAKQVIARVTAFVQGQQGAT